jgi:hypothetical protein
VAPPLQAFWIPDLVDYDHRRNVHAWDGDVSGNSDCVVGCDLGLADVRSSFSYDEFPLEALTFLQSNPESFSSKNC